MGEFANKIGMQAATMLRRMFQWEVTAGMDPILELIGFLLEDGAGGILPQTDIPITTDQWLTWNQLVTERPEILSHAMISVLEREQINLPSKTDAMRMWAACLLLNTLDQREML